MATEYYQKIVAEAEVLSDQLTEVLDQQANSPAEKEQTALGLAYRYFRFLDTENPYQVRVWDENMPRIFEGRPYRAKTNDLYRLLAQATPMTAQATLERFVPHAISTATGKNVECTYAFEGFEYMNPKYFDIRIATYPSQTQIS